jgi:uncharacterized cysteine cluster protein YcgN (CxxCxxCC family)
MHRAKHTANLRNLSGQEWQHQCQRQTQTCSSHFSYIVVHKKSSLKYKKVPVSLLHRETGTL